MIICLTLPILKRHSCWSFQIQQHVVRPCNELLNCALDTKKKNPAAPLQRCSKSHALVWTSTTRLQHSVSRKHTPHSFWPRLVTHARLLCVLHLTSVRTASRGEKRTETSVTCWIKLSARHWSNASIKYTEASDRQSEQLIPQTDAYSWVSKNSLCQQF